MTASHHPIRRTLILLLGLAAIAAGLLLVLRGPEADAASTVRLRADPHGAMKFDHTHVTVGRPGKVTLVMTNPKSSGMPHGIAIEGNGVDKDGPIVAPGKTSRLTVKLKKGRYEFYCPVRGHKAAGMKGTLTVK